MHPGWEGSAHDLRVMQEAVADTGFQFPRSPRGEHQIYPVYCNYSCCYSISYAIRVKSLFCVVVGSYYLVDSGYTIGSAFLPPHKSVRYHAQEFRGFARQPRTPQELFNYRHYSLRMVIERCFVVLKVRFPILNDMHSYSQSRQRLIVTAACALHNFIRMYSHADEMFHAWVGQDLEPGDASTLGDARVGGGGNEEAFSPQAKQAMSRFQDEIIAAMWAEYTSNHS